jgi:hypothetical protein
MKRQRGRGRKPGGGGGGGGNNHNHGNRSLESNGPDVKIRGTAAQIYEKYSQFARDAQSGGDRVKYENYLQHAEHYYRVMAATMPRERLLQQQNGEGGFIHAQTSEGGGMQPGDGGGAPQGEQHEQQAKSMDDGANDDGDDDGDDGDEGDGGSVNNTSSGGGGEEAGARDEGGEGGEGDRQGRNRRGRRRRRPQDGPAGDRQAERPAGGDPEARSALDSLARKQGALTGG